MAHLNEIIPDPERRKPIYQAFAAVGLLIAIAQVGFAAASAEQPTWLTVALAVYAFLGGAGFTVAQAHTNAATDLIVIETGDDDVDGADGDLEPIILPESE